MTTGQVILITALVLLLVFGGRAHRVTALRSFVWTVVALLVRVVWRK